MPPRLFEGIVFETFVDSINPKGRCTYFEHFRRIGLFVQSVERGSVQSAPRLDIPPVVVETQPTLNKRVVELHPRLDKRLPILDTGPGEEYSSYHGV